MKKKTLNLLILNFVIVVAIWIGYFYIVHQVKFVSSTFGDLKNKITFAMKKEQAVIALKSKIQNNLAQGVDLKDFLVHSDQSADVVQLVEGFGSLTGSNVSTQSVSTEEAVGLGDGVDFLKIVLKVDGTKSAVLECINLVESLPYNIKINKISFVKSGEASSTARWSAGIELVFVKLKDVEKGTSNQ